MGLINKRKNQRVEAKYHLKRAQEKFKDKETKQTELGGDVK